MHRIQKWRYFFLIALLLSLFWRKSEGVPPPVPTTIRAERFELVNRAGKVTARLEGDRNGQPQFQMLNDKGVPLISLVADSGGVTLLTLRDGKGWKEVVLRADENSASIKALRRYGKINYDHFPSDSQIVSLRVNDWGTAGLDITKLFFAGVGTSWNYVQLGVMQDVKTGTSVGLEMKPSDQKDVAKIQMGTSEKAGAKASFTQGRENLWTVPAPSGK